MIVVDKTRVCLPHWLLLVGIISLASDVPPATGEHPETLPPYSDAIALRQDASLHAVKFRNAEVGIAVGDRGVILRTVDRGGTWQPINSGVTCRLEDVHWIDDRNVVVIGGAYDRVTAISRGVALWSNDAGRRWNRAGDEELPYLRNFVPSRDDGGPLTASGDFSYVSLSYEFESSDGGRTWQGTGQSGLPATPANRRPSSAELRAWAEKTATPVPIRGACRTGPAEFWAVGDHGVILHSVDAGRTWQVRRGQGRHSAVLIVASTKSRVAWPMVANEAVEMRNRVSVLVDDKTLTQSNIDLLGQVSVMLGGAGCDSISAGGAIEQTATDWIAAHRPLVLVLDQDLADETHSAFTTAAIAAGIQRVVSYSFDDRGDTMLHRSALLPKRAMLVSDVWQDAMQWVAPEQIPPNALACRRTYDAVGTQLQGDSVTMGLMVPPGNKLSATVESASRRQLQIVQARMNQPKQIAQLIADSHSPEEFATTFGSMLDQAAKDDQFRLSWAVLQSVIQRQDLELPISLRMQQVVLGELGERFDYMSAGQWAQLRHDSIRHSDEWRRLRSSAATKTSKVARVVKAVPVSPFQSPSSEVRQVSAVSPLQVPQQTTIDLTPHVKKVSQVDLAWEFHPLVLVAREASRNRGDDQGLQTAGVGSANLKRLTNSSNGPWAKLLQSNSPRMIVASRAHKPPRLDGRLDDSCWTTAIAQQIGDVAIRFSYDDQHVYVAMQSSTALGVDSGIGNGRGRSRDHDLSQVDRLRLCIDTDLDLLSSMQLEFSQAGRTKDAIDGQSSWQPTWYVDSDRSDDQVVAEIAILRRDLIDLPIHPEQSWFVSAELLAAGKVTPWHTIPEPSDWLRLVFR